MITAPDFSTILLVEKTPAEVFNAINDVRGWWSEEIVGPTDELGEEFDYHYEDVHRCRIRVTALVPNKTVQWFVVENYFKFTQDETEWTGTEIIFEISENDDRTQIQFTHRGLVPAYECYEICQAAWTNYVQNSLFKLITTGKGEPNGTGKPRTENEQKLSGRHNQTNSDMSDYQQNILSGRPVSDAYAAVTQHISEWWSNDFNGTSLHPGDRFDIAFGNTRKTMDVVEALPHEKVVWECTKAYIDLEGLRNRGEWVGTRMIWTFAETPEGAVVYFLHKGLNRDLECYEVCEAGWNIFLASLESYLNTGEGKPFGKN